MFPLQITAAQAVAACINGRIFKMETRCYGHKSTRKIWREDGLIRAQQYWSQYGWLKETLREDGEISPLCAAETKPLEKLRAKRHICHH